MAGVGGEDGVGESRHHGDNGCGGCYPPMCSAGDRLLDAEAQKPVPGHGNR